jgi:fused signal recognition particle receptor
MDELKTAIKLEVSRGKVRTTELYGIISGLLDLILEVKESVKVPPVVEVPEPEPVAAEPEVTPEPVVEVPEPEVTPEPEAPPSSPEPEPEPEEPEESDGADDEADAEAETEAEAPVKKSKKSRR